MSGSVEETHYYNYKDTVPASLLAKVKTFIIMADQQDDTNALLNDSSTPALEPAMAKAREVLDKLHNVVLNIAITGVTGAGKSSLVNAIRGVGDADELAAKIGEKETTTECAMYKHPSMPNVKIWDLPGIGSPKFKAKTYMKDVTFQIYDFFIIVGGKRFTENDLLLAKEIKGTGKNFYFVRSMIDQDVANAARRGVMENETCQTIREDCEQNLKEMGSPHVFLISSCDLDRFDFKELQKALETDLPDHKRDALVLSLPVYSKQCLEKKYKIFKKTSWALAAASAGIAAAPVPGLSAACDVAMVVSYFTTCYHSFGLDDKSLTKLGKRVDKRILEKVKESKLVQAIASKTFLNTAMAGRLLAAGGIEALCVLVPGVGSVAAAGISYVTTKAVLDEGLKEMYKVAQEVLEMAEL
ncbi:interferon-inducible GTPase 5-like [Sardina pilchardus]|uniref:interferon-inducible GTPase 5-like n=1 Tax=Sardina pilchardus TaxID=27697 RepID=UPI002E164FC7